jgi:hypothetical protein
MHDIRYSAASFAPGQGNINSSDPVHVDTLEALPQEVAKAA